MKFNSFNNRFILEPYHSDRAIKMTTGSGFALIAQKVSLTPLRLKVDFEGIVHGYYTHLPKDSVVYIREEFLHTQAWAKQVLECSDIDGKFIIVDSMYVEMIRKPE